jgi:hypothetical protein
MEVLRFFELATEISAQQMARVHMRTFARPSMDHDHAPVDPACRCAGRHGGVAAPFKGCATHETSHPKLQLPKDSAGKG